MDRVRFIGWSWDIAVIPAGFWRLQNLLDFGACWQRCRTGLWLGMNFNRGIVWQAVLAPSILQDIQRATHMQEETAVFLETATRECLGDAFVHCPVFGLLSPFVTFRARSVWVTTLVCAFGEVCWTPGWYSAKSLPSIFLFICLLGCLTQSTQMRALLTFQGGSCFAELRFHVLGMYLLWFSLL